MRARGRPWSWITGRPRLADALVVAFNLVAGLVALLGAWLSSRQPAIVVLAVVVVAQAVALWWRRTKPVAVLTVIVLLETGVVVVGTPHESSGVGLAFAVYAVSVYDRPRVRLAVAAFAIAVILVAVFSLVFGNLQVARILIPAGALSLVAWVIGDYIRSRRQLFGELVARHEQERQTAAEEERLRIARELHDVVAHNVSAMAIQAGAARVAGSSPEEALESIEQGARATLSELNRLLGVLRRSQGPPLAPQPTLDDAETLLKPARDGGIEATLKITGRPRPLPQAAELSAYRIIQEAITNVLKHASATRVEILIDYAPDALVLTVIDDGRGAASTDGGGHGLVGMRERVQLFGGELTTESSSLGGFKVRATLPVKS